MREGEGETTKNNAKATGRGSRRREKGWDEEEATEQRVKKGHE